MIDLTTLQRDALTGRLDALYAGLWGDHDPEVPGIVAAAADQALTRIAGSDALYHDVEHTVLVTLVGAHMLAGRQVLHGGTTPDDWLHVLLALLFHDIGYVRGACSDDAPGAWCTGVHDEVVALPPGSTDAALQPWHVDRGIRLIHERFGGTARVDADVVSACIDYTRFPVPDGPGYRETTSLRALVRAADLLGQLADPKYLQKLPSLYHEFREIGLDRVHGLRSAADLRADFPRFYETTVRPLVGDALVWLSATEEGRRALTSLETNLHHARSP